MIRFIVIAALVSTGATAATFDSAKCRIHFEYPATWHAQTLSHSPSGDCVIAVDPPDWEKTLAASQYETEKHAIYVKVYRASFPETAAQASFFLLEDGKWRIVGRGNDFPHPITTPCCFGLRGRMTYGLFLKGGEGGYQGLGEYDLALLGSARGSVVVSAPGGQTAAFERILSTLNPESSSSTSRRTGRKRGR